MGPCGWGWVGKEGYFEREGAQKGLRVGHCIIQIRTEGGKKVQKRAKRLGQAHCIIQISSSKTNEAASAEKLDIFSS